MQLGSRPSPDGDTAEQTKSLAAEMGNLVILRKGHIDTISDGSLGIIIIFYLELYRRLLNIIIKLD